MGGAETLASLRGFKDLLPEEAFKWRQIESAAHAAFAAFGFHPIGTPLLEPAELFTRSIGATSDIIEKEMYAFDDWDGRKVSLRPEGTVSVVRAYLTHHLSDSALRKFYYIGPMFRHERPQAGRLRQFHQIGVEIIGDASPKRDVELLALLDDLMQRLGVNGLPLTINTLGCPECRPSYRMALQFYLSGQSDLCVDCLRRSAVNPLRVLDCKKETCREAVRGAPSPIDDLCKACQCHFEAVRSTLSDLGLVYTLNPHLVRGLDYYTRTVFELNSPALGAQNAVAAGGRYDALVALLGGPQTPAIGFAIGVERLAALVSFPQQPDLPLFLVPLGENAARRLFPLLFALRRKNLACEIGEETAGLKAQLKRADRLHATYAFIVGEAELNTGVALLRNMRTGTQQTVAIAQAADILPDVCTPVSSSSVIPPRL